MALLPKKTYSRHNDLTLLGDKEKENVDPFDELLSSPLKQDVQFQPLSFWGKKVRRLESKEKSKSIDCGLFKESDSDDLISPCQGKRKPKTGKARTLQPKSQKLRNRRKNNSTMTFFIKRTKALSHVPKINKTVISTDEIGENKGRPLDSTLYFNDSMDETLNSSHKSCDTSKFSNIKRHFNKKNSNTHSYSGGSELNCQKKFNESCDIIKPKNFNFKVYEDVSISMQPLCKFGGETVTDNSKENSTNGAIYFDKTMDETLKSYPLSHDSFKFVSVRRHFPFPDYSAKDGSFLESTYLKNSPLEFCDEPKNYMSPINSKLKHVDTLAELDEETLSYFDSSLVKAAVNEEETLCAPDLASDWNEMSSEISMSTCQAENTVSDITSLTEFSNETLTYCENSLINTSLNYNGADKSPPNEISSPDLREETKDISMLDITLSDLMALNDTELEVVIQELWNANAVDGVVLETSSTSDDTLSSLMDEETVINVKLKAEKGDSPVTDSGTTKDVSHSVSNGVSVLTDSMSELNIKNTPGGDSPEPKNEKLYVSQDSKYKGKGRNSFSMDLRNVTTKRRGVVHKTYGRNVQDERLSRDIRRELQKEDTEMDQSQLIMGRTSMDWNKSIYFANPVFESTRVFDTGPQGRKRQTNRFEKVESVLEDTQLGLDRTYALKPGKKWLRSRSVLKQLQNGTISGGRLESTRITGRKFESFVQEMLEIQNEKSGFFTSLADVTVSNKTAAGANVQNTRLPGYNASKTVLECENLPEKPNQTVFSNSNETVLEKSSLNHTVKVIQLEEKPSAFRSALGLENNNSIVQEDSVLEESSTISARDFILMQCGQEDVLPFEEHFNERTLGNCRKIGEGVYGEVFMCSDTVIKIIPIEGTDKVNGEPQKTFAEIISEVVIASKLSNLREGKKHRTDGFSEMKRCWCVKGKYPKYLLKLWKEYDEQGSGSENDSPVMFKADQLYIILELSNGGKDLESFVFNSSAQSLSIFIQTAFSLAAAEKAFEFEHRDLHWGNVLISETKEKFVSVYLDGVEYKIPTKGVKVCIIDFTLSRINHEGCCIFNDLSVDPSLFASEGDYQFEIYRMMLKEVKNDWSLFRPKTNIFWLHYTLDKMLKMVRYKNKKAKIHIKHLKDLKSLESVVLDHKDSTDFALGRPLNDVINKL